MEDIDWRLKEMFHVNDTVYENDFGKEGIITHIDEDWTGCTVEFVDGEITWMSFDSISKY